MTDELKKQLLGYELTYFVRHDLEKLISIYEQRIVSLNQQVNALKEELK